LPTGIGFRVALTVLPLLTLLLAEAGCGRTVTLLFTTASD
jgi:hypothetical protein